MSEIPVSNVIELRPSAGLRYGPSLQQAMDLEDKIMRVVLSYSDNCELHPHTAIAALSAAMRDLIMSYKESDIQASLFEFTRSLVNDLERAE